MDAEAKDRDFEAWAASLQAEYDAFLRQSWAAMQAARKGHWIEDTEEHVRQAGEAFRRKALEQLLQMQVEAEQKSFSPSARGAVDQQGSAARDAPDGGGARGGPAAGMAAAGRRRGRTGG
jgi:hypothetical protein